MLCVCSLRFSSVQLLGDLLFHVSGVTGKMTTETASEDDNFGTAQSNKVTVMSLWNRPQDSVLTAVLSLQDQNISLASCCVPGNFVCKCLLYTPPGHYWSAGRRETQPRAFGALHGPLGHTAGGQTGVSPRVEDRGDKHTANATRDPAHPVHAAAGLPGLHLPGQENGTIPRQTSPSEINHSCPS